MLAVVEVDLTAADMLLELCDELDRRGVTPALARVEPEAGDGPAAPAPWP